MTPNRRLGRRNRPVFIERSGRRRRLLRSVAAVLGCACAGYLLFLVVLVDALREPPGTAPPRMDVPLQTTNARHDTAVHDGVRPDDGDGTGRPGSRARPGDQAEPTPTPTSTLTSTTGPAVPRDRR